MSTHCTFYKTGKRMNSTLRPSADGNTWGVDCNFFDPFDILSPEILLRDEGLGTAYLPGKTVTATGMHIYAPDNDIPLKGICVSNGIYFPGCSGKLKRNFLTGTVS